jgi:hypothetical protein
VIPPGYVPMPEASCMAADVWFAFVWNLGPDADQIAWIVHHTVGGLQRHLYEKEITAYYFGDGVLLKGRHAVDRDFWATEAALRALREGRYFPFGRGQFSYEAKPSFPLFVVETELRALLSEEQSAKKVPLPDAKKADLARALREQLDDLPREAQRKTVTELPEFQKYLITDDDFREAAKGAPRTPGRKPKRK